MWHILGIEPTTDLKAIKSAYAKLAKQYNPEEYPEEFKRIFDAYKSACAYAKKHRRSDIPIQKTSENQTTEQQNEKRFDFSYTNAHSRHEDTKNNDEKPLDFSGIDMHSKPEKIHTADENQLNFSEIDVNKKSESDRAENNEFNFSCVNENYDEERHRIFICRNLIIRLKKIVVDSEFEEWKKFFDETDFHSIVNDIEFRWEAKKIINGRVFQQKTAQLIAAEFGMGSITVLCNSKLNLWGVEIRTDNNFQTASKERKYEKPRKKLGFIIAAAAVFLYIVLPFIEVTNPNTSENYDIGTNQGYEAINLGTFENENDTGEFLANSLYKIVDETTFDVEELYKLCVGKWVFDFGYIEFFDNGTFEMEFNGVCYSGITICTAAEKGAKMYVTFYAEENVIDNTSGFINVFSRDSKAMSYTDNQQVTHIGFLEESENKS